MKVTPDQIRAARALLRLEPNELAELAHVSVAAVSDAETQETSEADAAEVVRGALERAGAEFIPEGVRRRRPLRPDAQERFERAMEISRASAAELQGRSDLLTDDDLYDENGLPA